MKQNSFFSRIFKGLRRRRNPNFRSFDAASVGRLLADWGTTSKTADEEIRSGLNNLRARSRELCRNNDYAKKFQSLLAMNVVGPTGIGIQIKALAKSGEGFDTAANAKIENAWLNWCKKENASVTRKQSFADMQRLFIQSVARDGEILIRKVRGFDNPFRFALQFLEPDYLDHNLNQTMNGNRVKMGVELNAWGEPVFYHLLTAHPGDTTYTWAGTLRDRIPASDIIHAYVMDRPEQTRGIPWMHSAMVRLNMLGRYEEAELVASRVGAAKMGFFTSPEGYGGDGTDGDGNLVTEVTPGKFEALPEGVQFEKFDVDHPTTSFESFCKAVLRGAACGLNVSYNSLASDLESTSYSSLRQGVLEQRDAWKLLQAWTIDHFLTEVFSEWLPLAMLTGQVNLPMAQIDRFNTPRWQPKRWAWIDPLKDMQANEKAVEKGFRTRTDIIGEQGGDLDDTFAQLKHEKDKAAELGLSFETQKPTKGANNGV